MRHTLSSIISDMEQARRRALRHMTSQFKPRKPYTNSMKGHLEYDDPIPLQERRYRITTLKDNVESEIDHTIEELYREVEKLVGTLEPYPVLTRLTIRRVK